MKVSIGIALATGLVVLASAVVLIQRSIAADEAAAQAKMEAEAARIQQEHEATQASRRAAASAHAAGLASAIAGAQFTDSPDGPHDGTIRFAKWAAGHMTLADVGDRSNPATTYAKVMANAATERGKRLCLLASVNQLMSGVGETGPFHMGLMIDGEANFYTVIAVRDASEVRKNSIVNFCGVVVGKEGFIDTADQKQESVRLVGMFLTPLNVARWRGSDLPIETIATVDGVGAKVLNL